MITTPCGNGEAEFLLVACLQPEGSAAWRRHCGSGVAIVQYRPAQREPDGAGAKEGYNRAVTRDRDNGTATAGQMSVR